MRSPGLSLRIVLWTATAFAAVLFILGWGIFTRLSAELDAAALRSARQVAAQTVRLVAGSDRGEHLGLGDQGLVVGARRNELLVQVADAAGRVVQRSQPQGVGVPAHPGQSHQGVVRWLGRRAVFVSEPIRQGRTLVGSVQVVASLHVADAALVLLRRLLLEGGAAGIGLAVLVGLFVARRALRPVDALTRLATAVSEADLSRRLPPSGHHDELDRLATAFNRMLDRLQAAFERQARFVSDASHELRTPLAVISGYADLLRRWGARDEVVRDEALDAIARESERMQRLVTDLLFLARGAQGLTLRRRYFDLADLVAEVLREARALDPGRRIEDETRDVVPVTADWDLIKQLLWILLDNALKFTPADRAIRVRAALGQGVASVAVADEGPGMPPGAREHAFERFYRADPARRSGAGVGLGLAIAKEIAAAHGGTLRLDSREGEGTTVTLELPADLR